MGWESDTYNFTLLCGSLRIADWEEEVMKRGEREDYAVKVMKRGREERSGRMVTF